MLGLRLYDESTTGRGGSENYQFGFLDARDTPYVESAAAARDIGYRIYATRSGTN